MAAEGSGSKDNPWRLRTPPGTSEYTMYRDETLDPPALVCQVGKTTLSYRLCCLENLHAMLSEHGDWMVLGSADESKPAADGTVRQNRGVRVERTRENVFSVTATGQELSALVAGARLALDAMRASPEAPPNVMDLLGAGSRRLRPRPWAAG